MLRLNFLPRMKSPLLLAAALLGSAVHAQTPEAPKAVQEKLASAVYDWDQMPVTPNALGVRRAVFDGMTATVDKIHCHITTLNPGERSGDPRKHLQEEIIIVKEGSVEANFNGQTRTANAGSVIFFASGATTFLHNASKVPVTYIVLYYYTPLTPKS